MLERVFDKPGIVSLHPAALSVLTSAVARCLVLRSPSNKLEPFVERDRGHREAVRVVAAVVPRTGLTVAKSGPGPSASE
jgi:hypothetical protein